MSIYDWLGVFIWRIVKNKIIGDVLLGLHSLIA